MNNEKAIAEPFHITITDKGIIEIAFFGLQDENAIRSALSAIKAIIDDLQIQGKPANILADNKDVTRTTTKANQLVLKAYKEWTFHKAAGINANPFIRFVLNVIVNTAHLGDRVKLFQDKESAERWLLEP